MDNRLQITIGNEKYYEKTNDSNQKQDNLSMQRLNYVNAGSSGRHQMHHQVSSRDPRQRIHERPPPAPTRSQAGLDHQPDNIEYFSTFQDFDRRNLVSSFINDIRNQQQHSGDEARNIPPRVSPKPRQPESILRRTKHVPQQKEEQPTDSSQNVLNFLRRNDDLSSNELRKLRQMLAAEEESRSSPEQLHRPHHPPEPPSQRSRSPSHHSGLNNYSPELRSGSRESSRRHQEETPSSLEKDIIHQARSSVERGRSLQMATNVQSEDEDLFLYGEEEKSKEEPAHQQQSHMKAPPNHEFSSRPNASAPTHHQYSNVEAPPTRSREFSSRPNASVRQPSPQRFHPSSRDLLPPKPDILRYESQRMASDFPTSSKYHPRQQVDLREAIISSRPERPGSNRSSTHSRSPIRSTNHPRETNLSPGPTRRPRSTQSRSPSRYEVADPSSRLLNDNNVTPGGFDSDALKKVFSAIGFDFDLSAQNVQRAAAAEERRSSREYVPAPSSSAAEKKLSAYEELREQMDAILQHREQQQQRDQQLQEDLEQPQQHQRHPRRRSPSPLPPKHHKLAPESHIHGRNPLAQSLIRSDPLSEPLLRASGNSLNRGIAEQQITKNNGASLESLIHSDIGDGVDEDQLLSMLRKRLNDNVSAQKPSQQPPPIVIDDDEEEEQTGIVTKKKKKNKDEDRKSKKKRLKDLEDELAWIKEKFASQASQIMNIGKPVDEDAVEPQRKPDPIMKEKVEKTVSLQLPITQFSTSRIYIPR